MAARQGEGNAPIRRADPQRGRQRLWSVFPRLPGVVTAGATADEARDLAEQALAFHVEGMIEDGVPVPKPAPIEQIGADPDHPERASILVPLRIRLTARVFTVAGGTFPA